MFYDVLYSAKRQVLKKLDSADERPRGYPQEAGHEGQEPHLKVKPGIKLLSTLYSANRQVLKIN
jgi:hypothetical protein